jgi:hypothetical protein
VTSSRQFEAIDDPADPAWSGHAVELDARDATRRRVLRASAAVVLVAAAAVVMVVAFSSRDADRSLTMDRAVPEAAAPLVQSDNLVAVPQSSGTAPVPEVLPAPGGAPIGGSGWAPPQVTRPAFSSERITGDASGVSAVLMSRLDALAAELGEPIEIVSGWRTRHEQASLYRRYIAGTGNLAAVPGTSLHEVGRAADAYVDGVSLASVPGAVRLARLQGLHFPVPGEAWHVELIGDPQGSGRR